MSKTLLFTSFATWKPEQLSNSSDDLLIALQQAGVPDGWHFLQQIPVAFDLAVEKAIAHLQLLQPDVLICCGMAEKRTTLQVEIQAIRDEQCAAGVQRTIHRTNVDLAALMAALSITEMSEDAGKFVCNHLYFSVLDYVKHQRPEMQAVFVHVPILTEENFGLVLGDFGAIARRLSKL